jgi:serine/threonine protein kinase
MSGKTHPDSTMTKLMRSSVEDEILHRALRLPTSYPTQIAFAGSDGHYIETKYSFESPRPIGEGGTAVVYQVRDTQLNVTRALKVLLVDLRSDSVAEQRWRRERELLLALEKVDAPSVPTIYDVGIVDGLPVIVMQFVDGVTLAKKLAQLNHPDLLPSTPGNIDKYLLFVTGIINPLAASLAHIEKHFAGIEHQGFAHGDIKPSNIIVEMATKNAASATWDVGRVWLLDFGEASVRDASEARGLTPAYASPEQLTDWASQRSPRITPATDQYQLGIIIQELLRPVEPSAKRCHWSPKAISCAWKIRYLLRVAKMMTARVPADRFTDFKHVSRALERTESLPHRRIGASFALAAMAALLPLSLLSLRAPSDSRDARPINSQLVMTSVENEWKRWQESQLWGASEQQLEGQLTAQVEQWRAAYGKATADAVNQELRRRLSLLKGGQYVFRIVTAIPDNEFNHLSQQFPGQSPDALIMTLAINGKNIASFHGTVMPGQPVAFDSDQAAFSWEPGQRVELVIKTETKSERQRREDRDKARKVHDEAVKRYDAARAQYDKDYAIYQAAKANGERVFPPHPPGMAPLFFQASVLSFAVGIGGNHTDGGVMAIPSETKCVQVESRLFVGKFDDHSINWHIEVSSTQ